MSADTPRHGRPQAETSQGIGRIGRYACLVLLLAGVAACDSSRSRSSENESEHLLISDQFNNRVIKIDTAGNILWHFGNGPTDLTASSIIGVNDAQTVGDDLVLMAGTGAPPGTEPGCPSGCADNRVLLVDGAGNIKFQYGQFGVTGSGPNQLNTPVQCTWTPSQTVLITDQGNQRIIEVDQKGNLLWQYGQTGVSGNGPNQLNDPNSAELLENGHVLISDENNDRAIEVDRKNGNAIVATFTIGGSASGVAFASRLRNGDTLLTDSNNSRVVEVDATDKIVWQYTTNKQAGSNVAPLPTRAVRTAAGNTLISDQFNHRVIAVDSMGNIVASFGNLNAPGYGTANTMQGLNAPYDAKVVGDFTGLTPPMD